MATPNIVPRADGEGSIGTSLKKWAKGYFNALFINNVEVLPDTIPTASSIPIADANGKIDSEWIKDASETVKGVVELATPAEVLAGEDTERAVTPAGFKAALVSPAMTGSATLNGTTDNTVQLIGIVTTLFLEVGDVIRIQYSGYDKLHTVESITDDNSIIVNYGHAGNRGNGSLKLADQTATVTITRIAKWYNATLGLGQAWVGVTDIRASNTNYTSPTNRTISVSVTGYAPDRQNWHIVANGAVAAEGGSPSSGSRMRQQLQANIAGSTTYILQNPDDFFLWSELR